MADQYFIGDGNAGVANAGPLPRVGGVTWEHASVVGMLMYLVNTRPDTQFAVHQCGKYSHNPRASHAKAVKKICRYLQGTKSRGIRFKKKLLDPMDMRLNVFVDASFCPNWKDEDDNTTVQLLFILFGRTFYSCA